LCTGFHVFLSYYQSLSDCEDDSAKGAALNQVTESISRFGHREGLTDHLSGSGGLPKEIIVVGAGVVGLEYASFMAALGADVTLIDQRPALLEFVDRQIVEALSYHLRHLGVTFRLGEKVVQVGIDAKREFVSAELESGKRVHGDALIYAVGRQANGDQLHLEAAGLAADSRGRLKANQFFQTDVPHIYAAGDVIGFPALASTSMEQGRLAACHMFGISFEHMPELFPYGIYTIPEISMVGQTEETLTVNLSDGYNGKALPDMPAFQPYWGKPPYGMIGGRWKRRHHSKPATRHCPTRLRGAISDGRPYRDRIAGVSGMVVSPVCQLIFRDSLNQRGFWEALDFPRAVVRPVRR
jgi:hypothetical protein